MATSLPLPPAHGGITRAGGVASVWLIPASDPAPLPVAAITTVDADAASPSRLVLRALPRSVETIHRARPAEVLAAEEVRVTEAMVMEEFVAPTFSSRHRNFRHGKSHKMARASPFVSAVAWKEQLYCRAGKERVERERDVLPGMPVA